MHRTDNLTNSCADCLEIWQPQPSGILRVCIATALPLTEHTIKVKVNQSPYRPGVAHRVPGS